MTVDEEMEQLAGDLRRLKIEYETYFAGGMPRPPTVLIFRVEKIINRYSGGATEMTFRQRYRFGQLAQSYFAHKNLWRRKQKAKDEGGAAPRAQAAQANPASAGPEVFCTTISDPDVDTRQAAGLREAIARARARAGEPELGAGNLARFLREKVRQIKQSLGCDAVDFTVSVEGGKVKLRAVKAAEPERQSSRGPA